MIRVKYDLNITRGTRRVNLVTNRVISHEWGKNREVLTAIGTKRGHLWHMYSITLNQIMMATVKLSKWWLEHNLFDGE